jgi:hypothetical protein
MGLEVVLCVGDTFCEGKRRCKDLLRWKASFGPQNFNCVLKVEHPQWRREAFRFSEEEKSGEEELTFSQGRSYNSCQKKVM